MTYEEWRAVAGAIVGVAGVIGVVWAIWAWRDDNRREKEAAEWLSNGGPK